MTTETKESEMVRIRTSSDQTIVISGINENVFVEEIETKIATANKNVEDEALHALTGRPRICIACTMLALISPS